MNVSDELHRNNTGACIAISAELSLGAGARVCVCVLVQSRADGYQIFPSQRAELGSVLAFQLIMNEIRERLEVILNQYSGLFDVYEP